MQPQFKKSKTKQTKKFTLSVDLCLLEITLIKRQWYYGFKVRVLHLPAFFVVNVD